MRLNSVGTAASIAAIALAAAACGSTGGTSSSTTTTAAKAATPKATAQTELNSVASTRTVQATLSIKSPTIPTTPSGAVKNPQQLVEGFRLVIDESADANTPLANAGSNTGTEIDIDYGTTSLAKIVVIDGKHAYFYVNTAGANALPLALSASDQQSVSGVMAILGGKWFQLPDSLLKKAEARAKTETSTTAGSTSTTTVNAQQALADAHEIENDVLKASTVKSVTGAGGEKGVEISGSLATLEAALLPTIAKIGSSFGSKVPTTVPPKATTGTYSATVFGDGSTLTDLTAGVTTPSGSGSMTLSVAHANVIVKAPATSTPLPTSLLQELSGAAGSTS